MRTTLVAVVTVAVVLTQNCTEGRPSSASEPSTNGGAQGLGASAPSERTVESGSRAPTTEGVAGRVTSDGLRVRTTPSTIYGDIVATLSSGEELTVQTRTRWQEPIGSEISHWYQVSHGVGTEGWAYGAYVDVSRGMYVPVFSGPHEIPSERLAARFLEVATAVNSPSVGIPASVGEDLDPPFFGFAKESGVLVWTDRLGRLLAFNGHGVSVLLNLNLVWPHNVTIGSALGVVLDSALYIPGFASSMYEGQVVPGIVLNLASGVVQTDLEGDLLTRYLAQSVVPKQRSVVHVQEGFRGVFGGRVYGLFRSQHGQLQVYSSNGADTRPIATIPQEFARHSPVFLSKTTVALYMPRDGWNWEDTRGPYDLTLWNFREGRVTATDVLSADELRAYLSVHGPNYR